ncbi:hypothetical protein GQ600_16959 [Phytophthora cactorum]|nr:hypothetical protein GQ600_16959 [Phytophthora cactorum]
MIVVFARSRVRKATPRGEYQGTVSRHYLHSKCSLMFWGRWSRSQEEYLHEAASAIKGLTRECNQLRRERDHLQQELNNLASYLQSTGSGPPYMTSIKS